jgi:hypothetical protein
MVQSINFDAILTLGRLLWKKYPRPDAFAKSTI